MLLAMLRSNDRASKPRGPTRRSSRPLRAQDRAVFAGDRQRARGS